MLSIGSPGIGTAPTPFVPLPRTRRREGRRRDAAATVIPFPIRAGEGGRGRGRICSPMAYAMGYILPPLPGLLFRIVPRVAQTSSFDVCDCEARLCARQGPEGRNNLAQGASPGFRSAPTPFVPLPRPRGRGKGVGGRIATPRLAPWATFWRPCRDRASRDHPWPPQPGGTPRTKCLLDEL
jgi:hypothetical protein